MFLEWVTVSAAVLLTVWFFRKNKPKKKEVELTVCTPSWSPLNILWIDSLPPLSMSICSDLSNKKDDTVSDQRSWCVAPDNQFSPCFREQFYNFPGPSNSQADRVSQESLQFALSTTVGEQSDSEHGTVGLGRVPPPPDRVLQTSDSNPLMAVSPQSFIQ